MSATLYRVVYSYLYLKIKDKVMMPGSSEWLIILGAIVLIFGPSKLPKLGGAIGEAVRNLKQGLKGDNEAESRQNEEKKIISSKDP